MNFIDFERTVKRFLSPKNIFSATEFRREMGRKPYKNYAFEYMGLKFSYLDDGKNNEVTVRDDINKFKHIGPNNMYGITFDNKGLCHISTKEGFLLFLVALSREDKEESIGTFEQINAAITGEILAEVDPSRVWEFKFAKKLIFP